MERKLPINEKPFLTGYASHANFLAIISTIDDYEEWFFTNYIQLMSKKNFEVPHDVPLDFFIDIKRDSYYYLNNPLVYAQCIKLELLNVICPDIVEFIINAIDSNTYVDIWLDEYYIPVKNAYKRYSKPHNNLVYGYDKEKKYFYMAGYVQDGVNQFVGTYGIFHITFNELYDAYKNCPYNEWYKSIYLYSIESHGGTIEKYKFNIGTVKRSLESYLYSENSLFNYANVVPKTNRFSFGLDVYQDLLSNLDMGHYYPDDIRPLELLVEHKKCMVDRIIYLYSKKYISKEECEMLNLFSSEILKYTLKARNLQLKYIISKRGNLDYYRNLLRELPGIEKRFLEKMLSVLKANGVEA